MDHGIEVPAPEVEPAPKVEPAPAEPIAPVATTVAAEPVAPVASESSSLEYLIGAAVLVCFAAVWKVYRKFAQKAR